ncbi:hypothetical protein FKP32DRAFT_193703 [Trametes sanguinea]|nr:hypothetical protein FKP32DRAFT_193703 [Trametes sanguinea]
MTSWYAVAGTVFSAAASQGHREVKAYLDLNGISASLPWSAVRYCSHQGDFKVFQGALQSRLTYMAVASRASSKPALRQPTLQGASRSP